MLRILALVAMLAAPISADARLQGGGQQEPSPSTPASTPAPASPAATPADRDPSARITNFAFVEDGSTHRKVVSNFCVTHPSDRYCR